MPSERIAGRPAEMKLSRLACLVVLIEVGCDGPSDIDKAGPPLDYAKCQTVWALASPTGAALSFEKAAPYVMDFTVIDVNRDGKISEEEFRGACHGGWVKEASSGKIDPAAASLGTLQNPK
jgi:EF hand